MWTCKKCEKPVYFDPPDGGVESPSTPEGGVECSSTSKGALQPLGPQQACHAERIQSLGFDWHPSCLVCKECGKKLHPGQHAEHAAEPYCHHPCYGALFGPRLFGHGTRNECHGAFGKVNKKVDAERAMLESKVKEFNQIYEGRPGEISCREVNGRVVLEGMLRVHWAVSCVIHLKQEDETAPPSTSGGVNVARSRSNSSINNNNSGAATDDSDDDEPLWRDESPAPPPSLPPPPSATTPSTPNPNWPPTPYPTLRPSTSNTKLFSSSFDSPVRSSSSNSLDSPSGPQSCPVLSYTHNAPPHAPISHPLTTHDATDTPEVGATYCGTLVRSPSVKGEEETSYGGYGSLDSSHATIKTRTVRRRRDVDKGVTQSMRDSLIDISPDGSPQSAEDFVSGSASALPALTEDDTRTNEGGGDRGSDVSRSLRDGASGAAADGGGDDISNSGGGGGDRVSNNNGRSSPGSSRSLKKSGSTGRGGGEGVVKRVSFSQVDWREKFRGYTNGSEGGSDPRGSISRDVSGEDDSATLTSAVNGDPRDGGGTGGGEDSGGSTVNGGEEVLRKAPSRVKAVLRRRPGRRMDKKKVKRRCSINGHLYLRETSSFHLEPHCPPASVRVTSLTTTAQLITTLLEKYKIEMGAASFALYVIKDNGEQRRLPPEESPLTTRVLLGPHDSVARLVLCDANTTTDITPEMAEFVHLSLAECRAILRQYEQEEQVMIRKLRAKYDEMKFYMQYWMEQREKEERNSALLLGV